MGSYKEENGTTRVGDFLRKTKDIAPDLLNLVGNVTGVDMLKNLGKAIQGDTGMSAIDKSMALELLQQDIEEAKEVTKRWQADMTSDSWLSKNVRPMTLIFLTLFLAIIIVCDSAEAIDFNVKESYITLMEALLVTVYIAYFGSRGWEKYSKIKNK